MNWNDFLFIIVCFSFVLLTVSLSIRWLGELLLEYIELKAAILHGIEIQREENEPDQDKD